MNYGIYRGDLFYANLSPVVGSEQGGKRPIVVIQNDIGNRYSPTVIVLAITTQLKNKLPTHVKIDTRNLELKSDSIILAEQIRTIDKSRLIKKIGKVPKETMELIDNALAISLNI